jgi:lipopolysaccharide/colanic/teichoic acid biosynthesis glycosyltransferase
MIRLLDIIFSLLGLIILFPVFIIISFCIVIESKGGIFYTQNRVGKNGIDFKLYKFRSMAAGSDKGSLITVGEKDCRITTTGYFLRKYKLDELPQLVNVVKGEMSIVGPRPEVQKYVDKYTSEQKKILSVLPGITDYASIEYLDENRLLGNATDPDKVYIEYIMPDKLRYNMKYINNRTLKEYFKVIFLTFSKILRII